jgi:hypothetical protein
MDVLEYDSQLIAVSIHSNVCVWNLFGFYGPPQQTNRRIAWENLHVLLESLCGPWVCLGDFNVIFEDVEKEGGNIGCSSAPNFLKDLIFDLGAVDLGFSSNKFNWCNRRWGKGCIRERLDRSIASTEWRVLFPKTVLYHLGAIRSDHAPLLLDTNPCDFFSPRPFRFEAAWVRDPSCSEVISKSWMKPFAGCPSVKLCKKQNATKSALKAWNRNVFGLCQSHISELTQLIVEIQGKEMSVSNA